MIEKDEIDQKVKEFQIHTANVERDYVVGWLLAGIYSVSVLKDILILKGGNCLRKGYFETTRYSNDLDFSTQTAIQESLVLEEFNKICDFIQDQAGIAFDKTRNEIREKHRAAESRRERDNRRIYQVRIYFRDFYGNPETITIKVSLDIVEFDKIYLPVQSRFLIHPYSDAAQCQTQIRCVKLEEALADKLKCLLQRLHTVDLFDFVYSVFINRDIEVNRGEIVTTFLRKTIFQPAPGMARNLLLELPFDIFRGLWTRFLICPVQSFLDFDRALTIFKDGLGELFSTFPDGGGETRFFPSHFRNPIMEAGRSLTLLQVEYDGITRMVEPYSLVYKRRQDGVAHEYFYVYDRTGGRTSGERIKSFLHDKIGSIENTEEEFEPRYEVELSKAGEPGTKSYFGSPFSGSRPKTKSPTRSRRRGQRVTTGISSGVVYIIQCPYCNKKFRRSRLDTKLNKHKDNYGNQCYCRAGYLVDQRW